MSSAQSSAASAASNYLDLSGDDNFGIIPTGAVSSNTWLIVGAVVLVLAGLWFFFLRKK
jgi:LPXTG-motif cell wall-anchored protein